MQVILLWIFFTKTLNILQGESSNMKIPELAALLCYFAVVLGVGIYFFFKSRNSVGNEKSIFSAAEI